MASQNPNYQLLTFTNGTTVAFSQPLYISGDGFFLYSSALSSTWEQFNISPSVKLNAVDYNNEGIALFAGNNGVIVKHIPGTQNTEINVLDPNINFNDIKFYSGSKKAIAIGDSGSVFKTINAGKDWTKVTTPSYLSASLQAITFSTASHWWICGTSGTVVTSSNEGTSWYQFTDFYQLDNVLSPPAISSSVNETLFDFYDIKYVPYQNNTTPYNGTYTRVYVVGSSGSIFMCAPEVGIGSFTDFYPSFFYDISLAYTRNNPAHDSTTYYSILYTNEWYFSGSASTTVLPNNLGVGGTNGNMLLIDYNPAGSDPSRVDPDLQASKDFNNDPFSTAYISKSISVGSPNTITGGGIFSLVYGSAIPPNNSVFYERQFLLLTESGRLVEMDYPSQGDGDILLQSDTSTIFNTRASESFSGALTDIDVPLFENLYDGAYVRFTLDKPLPTIISSSINPNPLFWGVIKSGSAPDILRLPTQGMRLYRRFKGENFVTLTNLLPDGKGLLIPEGYNPELNYLEIAKNAGLLPSP